MNRTQIAVAATSLLLAIGGSSVTQIVAADTTPGTQYTIAQRERHPELRAALNNLRQARNHLLKGDHDFDGKRKEALEHTNEAIKELQEALAADRR